MPHALLLSPSGFNGQRRARQKPGGLTSIQVAQEAGRRGPWVTAWRGRTASGPGASDAGHGRQRAGASRGATAAARGECACARRCDPEVPLVSRGAQVGVLAASRPLLPESRCKPAGAVLDAASRACGRPSVPPGQARLRPGSERLRPETAAAVTLHFWKFVGAVLFFGSFRKTTPRDLVPVPEEQKRSFVASWSFLLEHVLSTDAKPSNKEVSSQEQHLQEGPGCWCRKSGSRFNRTLRFVPPRLVEE
ncbi:uncharacterized protein [Oryctolagus cuniculus]|uniref:uncharacterized protein isoform X2 n=1 Tax=Oryctolagus cuniculus TaxID=9986 RepID=UPI003879C4D7